MFFKYADAKVLDLSNDKVRTAGLKRLGSFDYEPRTDHKFLYVSARACTADVPNLNYDMLPHDELKEAYKSFIGAYVYLNHDNTDPRKARGAIIDAKYHDEDPDDKWVEILMEMDEEKCPKLCSLMRSGDIDTVSMGCSIQSSTCSICGNTAEFPHQFCDHIAQKGRTYDGKLAFEICNGIEFFEESVVFDPADPSAHFQGVDKEAMRRAAAIKTAESYPTYNITDYEGTLSTGYGSYFDSNYGNYMPGEPDDIEAGGSADIMLNGEVIAKVDFFDKLQSELYEEEGDISDEVYSYIEFYCETICEELASVIDWGSKQDIEDAIKGNSDDWDIYWDAIDRAKTAKINKQAAAITYTPEEFYEGTIANFEQIERPDGEPDYVSDSGSMYWYFDDGVIRGADHWGGGIGSCNWFLNGGAYSGYPNPYQDGDDIYRYGFCAWTDFQPQPYVMSAIEAEIERLSDYDNWVFAQIKNQKYRDPEVYAAEMSHSGAIPESASEYVREQVALRLASQKRASIGHTEEVPGFTEVDATYVLKDYMFGERKDDFQETVVKTIAANKKTADHVENFADAPRKPDEVGTNEDQRACPLCGSLSFDGEYCDVCGYQEPPEGFGDIELETKETYEEYQEDADAEEKEEEDMFGDKEAAEERFYDIADDPELFIGICEDEGFSDEYDLVGFDVLKTSNGALQDILEAEGAVEI